MLQLDMLQQSLHITYVEDSARWMGSSKHNYWHWLQCQLPAGQVSLADLKLTHPKVIPRRDRIAAPMWLASWIRFETAMTSEDWEGAISLLVYGIRKSFFPVHASTLANYEAVKKQFQGDGRNSGLMESVCKALTAELG